MKSNGTRKKEDNRNSKIIILVFAVIIIVLIGVILFLILGRDVPKASPDSIGTSAGVEEPKRNVVVTESNAEEAAAQMAAEDFVEPGYYVCNMALEWHFATGDAVSTDARVDNVFGNTNPVYFDVFLAEDETEPIYRSPVIPVGSFLEHIALEKILDAGTYDCVVVYHLVDEEQNTISTLRVEIQVIVES